ncbi:hypothetical protein D3C80_1422690 [compost metagenome]
MNRNRKPHLADQLQHGHILHNQCIRLNFIEEPQVFSGFFHIFFTEQIIDGNIHFFIQTVGNYQRLGNFLVRQIVAFAHHSHIKDRTAKIHRVTSRLNNILENLKRPCRCQ